MGLALLIIEASQSYSDTPHPVGLFWTSDQPVPESSTGTKHNIHKRQTSKLPAGFEPPILASNGQETHALDRAATGISSMIVENMESHEEIRSGRRFVGRSSKQALLPYKPAAMQLDSTSVFLLKQEQNFSLSASHRPGQRIVRTLSLLQGNKRR
jgi:hypothetical protein